MPLSHRQPARSIRIIRQHKSSNNPKRNSNRALDQEQPLPRPDPQRVLHIRQDACSDETAEALGCEVPEVEDRDAELHLAAGVPPGEEVDASREEGGFDAAKEEAAHDGADGVVGEGCEGADDAPYDDAGAEIPV